MASIDISAIFGEEEEKKESKIDISALDFIDTEPIKPAQKVEPKIDIGAIFSEDTSTPSTPTPVEPVSIKPTPATPATPTRPQGDFDRALDALPERGTDYRVIPRQEPQPTTRDSVAPVAPIKKEAAPVVPEQDLIEGLAGDTGGVTFTPTSEAKIPEELQGEGEFYSPTIRGDAEDITTIEFQDFSEKVTKAYGEDSYATPITPLSDEEMPFEAPKIPKWLDVVSDYLPVVNIAKQGIKTIGKENSEMVVRSVESIAKGALATAQSVLSESYQKNAPMSNNPEEFAAKAVDLKKQSEETLKRSQLSNPAYAVEEARKVINEAIDNGALLDFVPYAKDGLFNTLVDFNVAALASQGRHEEALELSDAVSAMMRPDADDGLVINTLRSIARMAPAMGASMAIGSIPVVGQAGVFTFWGAQGMGQSYGDMVQEGVDPDAALELSMAFAPVYAALGSAQQHTIGRFFKDGAMRNIFQEGLKYLPKRLGSQATNTFGTIAEESAQRISLETAKYLGTTEVEDRNFGKYARKMIDMGTEEFVGVAPTMIALSLFGMASGATGSLMRYSESQTQVANQVQGFGYSKENAKKIAKKATSNRVDPEVFPVAIQAEQTALMMEEVGKRNPKWMDQLREVTGSPSSAGLDQVINKMSGENRLEKIQTLTEVLSNSESATNGFWEGVQAINNGNQKASIDAIIEQSPDLAYLTRGREFNSTELERVLQRGQELIDQGVLKLEADGIGNTVITPTGQGLPDALVQAETVKGSEVDSEAGNLLTSRSEPLSITDQTTDVEVETPVLPEAETVQEDGVLDLDAIFGDDNTYLTGSEITEQELTGEIVATSSDGEVVGSIERQPGSDFDTIIVNTEDSVVKRGLIDKLIPTITEDSPIRITATPSDVDMYLAKGFEIVGRDGKNPIVQFDETNYTLRPKGKDGIETKTGLRVGQELSTVIKRSEERNKPAVIGYVDIINLNGINAFFEGDSKDSKGRTYNEAWAKEWTNKHPDYPLWFGEGDFRGGHNASDALLRYMSDEIKNSFDGKKSAIYREGGDEIMTVSYNKTLSEVDEILSGVNKRVKATVKDAGLDTIGHLKMDRFPTGTGLHYGVGEASGDLDSYRKAQTKAEELIAERKLQDYTELSQQIVDNEGRPEYVIDKEAIEARKIKVEDRLEGIYKDYLDNKISVKEFNDNLKKELKDVLGKDFDATGQMEQVGIPSSGERDKDGKITRRGSGKSKKTDRTKRGTNRSTEEYGADNGAPRSLRAEDLFLESIQDEVIAERVKTIKPNLDDYLDDYRENKNVIETKFGDIRVEADKFVKLNKKGVEVSSASDIIEILKKWSAPRVSKRWPSKLTSSKDIIQSKFGKIDNFYRVKPGAGDYINTETGQLVDKYTTFGELVYTSDNKIVLHVGEDVDVNQFNFEMEEKILDHRIGMGNKVRESVIDAGKKGQIKPLSVVELARLKEGLDKLPPHKVDGVKRILEKVVDEWHNRLVFDGGEFNREVLRRLGDDAETVDGLLDFIDITGKEIAARKRALKNQQQESIVDKLSPDSFVFVAPKKDLSMPEGQGVFEGRSPYGSNPIIAQERIYAYNNADPFTTPENLGTFKREVLNIFANQDYTAFKGKKINNIQDAVDLFSILRDPNVEHFWTIYTKGDEAVGVSHTTSMCPYACKVAGDEPAFSNVPEQMKSFGADGFYIVHNHPGGNMEASGADMGTTAVAEKISGYRGHIVNNHIKALVMMPKAAPELINYSKELVDNRKAYYVKDGKVISKTISIKNEEDAATVAQSLGKDNVIIFTDRNLNVRSVEDLGFYLPRKDGTPLAESFLNRIKQAELDNLHSSAIIVTGDDTVARVVANTEGIGGVITDVVYFRDGRVISNLYRIRTGESPWGVEFKGFDNVALENSAKYETSNLSGTQDLDYRGAHQMTYDPEITVPLHDLLKNGVMPKDIYTHPQYYADGLAADKESINIIKKMRGNPEGEVTIYRAVPDIATKINDGDWVTLSKTYAKNHIEHVSREGEKWKVLSMEVPAKDVFWNGDSFNEFAYFPDTDQKTVQEGEPNYTQTDLFGFHDERSDAQKMADARKLGGNPDFEGLPMFDMNEQEARSLAQGDLFAGDLFEPPAEYGKNPFQKARKIARRKVALDKFITKVNENLKYIDSMFEKGLSQEEVLKPYVDSKVKLDELEKEQKNELIRKQNRNILDQWARAYMHLAKLDGHKLSSDQRTHVRNFIKNNPRLTEAGLEKIQNKARELVEKYVDENQRLKAVAQIEKLFKSTMKKTKEGRAFYLQETRDKVKELISRYDFHRISADKRVELEAKRQTLRQLESTPLPYPADVQVMINNLRAETARLDKTPMADLTIEQLRELFVEMNTLLEADQAARGEYVQKVEKQKDSIVQKTITNISTFELQERDTFRPNFIGNYLGAGSIGPVELFEIIDGVSYTDKNAGIGMMIRLFTDAHNKASKILREFKEGWNELPVVPKDKLSKIAFWSPSYMDKYSLTLTPAGRKVKNREKYGYTFVFEGGVEAKLMADELISLYLHSFNLHNKQSILRDGITLEGNMYPQLSRISEYDSQAKELGYSNASDLIKQSRTGKILTGEALKLYGEIEKAMALNPVPDTAVTESDLNRARIMVEANPDFLEMAEYIYNYANITNKQLLLEGSDKVMAALQVIDNYWTLRRAGIESPLLGEGTLAEVIHQLQGYLATVEQSPMFQSRKPSARGVVVLEGAFDTIHRIASTTAIYNAYALPLRIAHAVSKELGGEFAKRGLKKYHYEIEKYIRDIEGAKFDQSDTAKLSKLMMATAITKVFGANLTIPIRQLWSYFRVGALVDNQDYGLFTKAFFHEDLILEKGAFDRIRRIIKDHSGILHERINEGGYSLDLARAKTKQEPSSAIFGEKLALRDISTKLISFVDSETCLRVCEMARSIIEEGSMQNAEFTIEVDGEYVTKNFQEMTEIEKEKAIAVYAEELFAKSQPQYIKEFQSRQARNTDLPSRIIALFMTDNNRIYSRIFYNVNRYNRAKAEVKKRRAIFNKTSGDAKKVAETLYTESLIQRHEAAEKLVKSILFDIITNIIGMLGTDWLADKIYNKEATEKDWGARFFKYTASIPFWGKFLAPLANVAWRTGGAIWDHFENEDAEVTAGQVFREGVLSKEFDRNYDGMMAGLLTQSIWLLSEIPNLPENIQDKRYDLLARQAVRAADVLVTFPIPKVGGLPINNLYRIGSAVHESFTATPKTEFEKALEDHNKQARKSGMKEMEFDFSKRRTITHKPVWSGADSKKYRMDEPTLIAVTERVRQLASEVYDPSIIKDIRYSNMTTGEKIKQERLYIKGLIDGIQKSDNPASEILRRNKFIGRGAWEIAVQEVVYPNIDKMREVE